LTKLTAGNRAHDTGTLPVINISTGYQQ